MDFKQMQYIIKVAQCASITKAAAELYIAQPSLSNYIAKAERELGVLLFDRSTSPIMLTFAGEEYVKDAKRILYLQEQMQKKLGDISSVTRGRIRVGIPYERGSYMLPLILPKFRQDFSQTEVQITTAASDKLKEALNNGEIDFYILPTTVQDPDKSYISIYTEELMLCAGAGIIQPEHLVEGRLDAVDIAKCHHLPFVQMEGGHAITEATDALYAGHFASSNVAVTMYGLSGAVRMAAAGMGITIAPRLTLELIRFDPTACVYSIGHPPLHWEVQAVYRKDAYLGIAERAFIDLAVRAFRPYTEQFNQKVR